MKAEETHTHKHTRRKAEETVGGPGQVLMFCSQFVCSGGKLRLQARVVKYNHYFLS